MINESARLLTLNRLKSEDFSTDDSSDWLILRLNSKLNSCEIRYNELLIRVNNLICKFASSIDSLLSTLDEKSQNQLLTEISYFQKKSEQVYSNSFNLDIKNELLDRLFDQDFSKAKFKQTILNIFGELSSDYDQRTAAHSRIRSQDLEVEGRSTTPLKSTRISTSPCEKTWARYLKEDPDSKNKTPEVPKHVKMIEFKENIEAGLSFQMLAKALKDENEVLAMKITCLQNKLTYIVSCVYKFISNTSKFQKVRRELEGYLNLMTYETEKHKIEVKLREVLENDGLGWKNPPVKQSCVAFTRVVDSRKSEHKRRSSEAAPDKINLKLIEEITKQYTEKIESLSNSIVKLETENRSLKNKFFAVNKELKQSRSQAEGKIAEILEKGKKEMIGSNKSAIVKQLKNFAFKVEEKLESLSKKLQQKSEKVTNLKSLVIRALQGNLSSLIELNKQAEKTHTSQTNDLLVQIENFKFIVDSNQTFFNNKEKVLQSVINSAEADKDKLLVLVKDLENKVFLLQKENFSINELETLKVSQEQKISSLQNECKRLKDTQKELKVQNIRFHQVEAEKESLIKEILNLKEKLAKKTTENQSNHQKIIEKLMIINENSASFNENRLVFLKSPPVFNEKIEKPKSFKETETMTDKILDFENFQDFNDSLTEYSPFTDERFSRGEDLANENPKFAAMVLMSSNPKFSFPQADLSISETTSTSIPATSKVEVVQIEVTVNCFDPESQEKMQEIQESLERFKKSVFQQMLEKETLQSELLKTRETYKKLFRFQQPDQKALKFTPDKRMSRIDLSRYT